jgi:hypothetical protein
MPYVSSPPVFVDVITPPSTCSYPATQVIHDLIHRISIFVCSSRRNTLVSFKLVELARNLYDEINTRIYQVEQTGDWSLYDIYSQAIDPLEQCVFFLSPNISADILIVAQSAPWDYLRDAR